MITQIYTAQNRSEAVALARAGVDHVGLTVSSRDLPGAIDLELGREIVTVLRDTDAKSVGLTVESGLGSIKDFISELVPDIVHLCGDTSLVGPDDVAALRAWMSERGIKTEVMQAIAMTGPEAVETAIQFVPHVDWLILDSYTEAVDGIGAAGVTHDWNLSRQIVDAVTVPVILAGGLGPDNVAEAIRRVHPAGVDSLTKTNRTQPDGTFTKDLTAVQRFVRSAGSTSI